MHQNTKPPGKTRQTAQAQTTWRLVEGDSKRVHKVIQEALDRTGDDSFELEFRIYRSSHRGTGSPEIEKPAPHRQIGQEETVGKRPRRRDSSLRWKPILVATVPVALSVYYLTLVAPLVVPVPAGVSVPFPAATRFLEQVCLWCGEFPLVAVLIGLALLSPGLLFRSLRKPERYYIPVAVVVSLALGLTYLSISAPLHRLGNAAEAVEPDTPQATDRPYPISG